ncbi:hypothetical protein [Ligilactobacillus acidipiscis]|uniref:hypothetical protein n=1 Tax=Ligilactobacillus acidipiscis TaxID=89059 RepID=UPI0022E62D7D|nr:hypothetical protein [Ligilactobacillus acidipiscis]
MSSLTLLTLSIAIVFIIIYIYIKHVENREIRKIIRKNRLPFFYGKHFNTFQILKRVIFFFIMLAFGSFAICFHILASAQLEDLFYYLTDGFFFIFIAYFLELIKNHLDKKWKFKKDPDFLVSPTLFKLKSISIWGLCLCSFILYLLSLLEISKF